MAKVVPTKIELDQAAREGNPSCYLDAMLRRFKRQVKEQEILLDYKKHDFFIKKGLARKEKAKRAKIRAIQSR